MVILECGLQTLQDLDRILDRGFVHIDLLEAPQQGAVLFEVIAEFLVGGRTDAADRTAGQCGLEQVRGVHRPAAGRTGTDHGVDFIDEQDGFGHAFEFVHDLFEPFFEVAAIAGTGKQRAHVERIDHCILQHFGHVAFHDLAGETFGDRRFADTRIADIKRIVLAAAAENLDGAVDFGAAADQRIDPSVFGLLVEIDRELVERGFLLALFAGLFLGLRFAAFRAVGWPVFDLLAALADAVADEADRIEPAHVLLLQEIDGVAVAFGK